MRLHRFYIKKPIEDKKVYIEDENLIHQWRDVFRYMVGAQVIVFNGDGYEYNCLITELLKRSAVLEIISRRKSVLPEKNIGLVISLIKKDNMEMVVQKASELGVSSIFPVVSERSEKKSLNMERARKIAVESSEQSGRGDVIEIFEPMSLGEFFENEHLQQFEKKIIFHPKEEKLDMAVIQNESRSGSILVAIGPEGGFAEEEVAQFVTNGFKKYSLGNLVLRAETAALAVMALMSLT
jgi:16S rRNA (uracil1498-N3)-methyltransferase